MGKISMQNIMENLLVQWGLENLIVIFKGKYYIRDIRYIHFCSLFNTLWLKIDNTLIDIFNKFLIILMVNSIMK